MIPSNIISQRIKPDIITLGKEDSYQFSEFQQNTKEHHNSLKNIYGCNVSLSKESCEPSHQISGATIDFASPRQEQFINDQESFQPQKRIKKIKKISSIALKETNHKSYSQSNSSIRQETKTPVTSRRSLQEQIIISDVPSKITGQQLLFEPISNRPEGYQESASLQNTIIYNRGYLENNASTKSQETILSHDSNSSKNQSIITSPSPYDNQGIFNNFKDQCVQDFLHLEFQKRQAKQSQSQKYRKSSMRETFKKYNQLQMIDKYLLMQQAKLYKSQSLINQTQIGGQPVYYQNKYQENDGSSNLYHYNKQGYQSPFQINQFEDQQIMPQPLKYFPQTTANTMDRYESNIHCPSTIKNHHTYQNQQIQQTFQQPHSQFMDANIKIQQFYPPPTMQSQIETPFIQRQEYIPQTPFLHPYPQNPFQQTQALPEWINSKNSKKSFDCSKYKNQYKNQKKSNEEQQSYKRCFYEPQEDNLITDSDSKINIFEEPNLLNCNFKFLEFLNDESDENNIRDEKLFGVKSEIKEVDTNQLNSLYLIQ